MYDEDSIERITNKPNPQGYTPLYIACKNGNLDVFLAKKYSFNFFSSS